MAKKAIPAVLLILVLIAAIVGVRRTDDASKSPPPRQGSRTAPEALPVYTHRVAAQPLRETVTATGTVLAEEAVDLTSETSGKVVAINFEEGSRVAEGDLLVKIDDSELQAQLQRLIHQVELARLQANRQRQLMEVQGTSQENYDAALNEQRVLEAEVALVRAQLAKTEVHAPFDGLVGLRYVSVGSYVSPSTRIASLQAIDRLKVDFSVAERHMNRIAPEGQITFTVAGRPDRFRAEIFAIEPRIDPATRTIRIRARAHNPDGRILPGAFATVSMPLRAIPDALLVPTSAVIPGLNERTVYVIEDGRAQPRDVEIGLRLAREIQITSGLSEGDIVITSGQLQLRPGLPVTATGNPPVEEPKA